MRRKKEKRKKKKETYINNYFIHSTYTRLQVILLTTYWVDNAILQHSLI